MSDKLLRGDVQIFTAVPGTMPPAPNEIPPAAWTSVGEKNLLTEDALTLSHTESIEDEMVLNETNAIDDYRVSEEWMLNFQSKDYTAETLQRAINNKPPFPWSCLPMLAKRATSECRSARAPPLISGRSWPGLTTARTEPV